MKVGGVFAIGLVLGLMGGLIYTWFVAPVSYYDTYPPLLEHRYRQDWIHMTAWAYGLDGNWERTETRLLNLPRAEVASGAAGALEQAAAQGRPVEVLQRLAELAAAYGASGPAVAVYTGQSLTAESDVTQPTSTATLRVLPTLTPTPSPTAPPVITPTPVITETAPFRIITQTLHCDTSPSIALSLEISRTVTQRGREREERVGLPMREVWLIWEEGADRAITGLRPEEGLGYVDFAVKPGLSYNLYIDAPSGPPVFVVQVEPCPPTEGTGWVSRSLVVLALPETMATSTPEGSLIVTPEVTTTLTATTTLTPTLTVSPSPTP
ncbi:MAG: hypothetical protein ACP5HS_01125 [Anaerolineae bacterium]